MNLLEKVFGKSEVTLKRRVVTCSHCDRLTSADAVREIAAEKCPSCGRLAPLMEGAEDVFACSCLPEQSEVRTYFGLRHGEPFTTKQLVRVQPLPEEDEGEIDRLPSRRREAAFAEREALVRRRSVEGIREKLVARRRELDAADHAAAMAVERRCVSEDCKKYCWPISGGVLECDGCGGKLRVCSEVKYCANEKCEKARPEPGFGQIREGRCRYCGEPAARRPGAIVEEVTR